jgi:hypothetical protein
MEQTFHENYNTGDRDTMSHHNGRLEAIRASSMVIGENRYSPETQFFGGQSRNEMKLNRLKIQRGTSQVPGRIIGTDTVRCSNSLLWPYLVRL